ncbi:hypothetical protein J6590_060128, partial [Homalodisca vitripennis]
MPSANLKNDWTDLANYFLKYSVNFEEAKASGTLSKRCYKTHLDDQSCECVLGSCCVLFAGTNDVTASETHSILEHLERQITNYSLSSSAVI